MAGRVGDYEVMELESDTLGNRLNGVGMITLKWSPNQKCGRLEMVMKKGQASAMVLQGVDWISSSRNIRRQGVDIYISI